LSEKSANDRFVLPVSQLFNQWQTHGALDLQWLLGPLAKLSKSEVLIYQVAPNTHFFSHIKEQITQAGLIPVCAIDEDLFHGFQNMEKFLQQGGQVALLLRNELRPESSVRLLELSQYFKQLKIVLVARKDWNMVNAYRSFPHSLRTQLYVDFPPRIHSKDQAFTVLEKREIISELQACFPGSVVQSFFPELAWHSRINQLNLSHFSPAQKLKSNPVKITMIADDPKLIGELNKWSNLSRYHSLIELLIPRTVNQPTRVVPKVKYLIPSHYWFQTVDPLKPANSAWIKNLTACHAGGEVVLFLQPTIMAHLDELVDSIVQGQWDDQTSLGNTWPVYRTVDFLAEGGYDPSFLGEQSREQDLIARIQNRRQPLANIGTDAELTMAKTAPLDRWRFMEKHNLSWDGNQELSAEGPTKSIADNLDQRRKKMRRYYWLQDKMSSYQSLYKFSYKVLFEGHLRYLLAPMVWLFRWVQSQLWRLRPNTYKSYWTLHRICTQMLNKVYWSSYRLYWRIKGNLWRFKPTVYQWYWALTFPLRKIYYFTYYQYEKRILGLHKRDGSRYPVKLP
jgi:hypothetical protein